MVERSQNAQFPQTRWSLVVSAKDRDGDSRQGALADLCNDYWYPIYVFVRRRGYSAHDAEDLTQGFFASLLARDAFSGADAGRGKLRSYLLGCLKHFLSDEADKAGALKRGGAHTVVSYDSLEAEERYRMEPRDELSPDLIFDKGWADTVLAMVRAQMRSEAAARGRAAEFDALQQFLEWGTDAGSYAEAAELLGITGNAVRVSVFRMRKRFGELLREAIADTVADTDDIAGELAYLFGAVGRR